MPARGPLSGSTPVIRSGSLGSDVGDSCLQLVHARCPRGHGGLVDEPFGEDHVDHRRQQPCVRRGDDRDVFEGLGCLGPQRVDDDHAPATLDDVAKIVTDLGIGQGRSVGHQRVRAEHEQEVGVHDVGQREDGGRAVEEPVGDLPSRLVLRPGGVVVARADGVHESLGPGAMGRAEGARVADVHRHRVRAVDVDDPLQPLGDLVESLLPADRRPLVASAAARCGDPRPWRVCVLAIAAPFGHR